MVLYHANGCVVIAHENYLEQQARKATLDNSYVEQTDVCLHRRDTAASTQPVRIIVDSQRFKILYCEQKDGSGKGIDWEYIGNFLQDDEFETSRDIDRDTLRRCSTLADEYFTYNPDENHLHLPVRYARQHVSNQGNMSPTVFQNHWPRSDVPGTRHVRQTDFQMAFIRPDEVRDVITPWLKKVQGAIESTKKTKYEEKEKQRQKKTPQRIDLQPTGRKMSLLII